tara:strand:+ start:364 stop:2313 length:1950 start_codon:yes stop_codon:yes gene_type:complete
MIAALKYCPVLTDREYPKLRKGTIQYRNWWKIQRARILSGYKPTGGTWIPGNYYFYLNFGKIHGLPPGAKRKTMISPIYRDQDHEYFKMVHDCKENGQGLICLKARRKGFSFMNVNILLHEWSCYGHSENGLGAQKEEYVQDFRKKLLLSYNELDPYLKNKMLHNNEDIMMSGYKQKEDGIWVERGMKSMLHYRVMDKPNAFRGTSLNYMVFEEAGEFVKLRRAYQANEECFREGAIQFGTPIIGGTANQINVDSDDFMEMFYNAQDYNLVPLFIPASKVYAGFFDMSTGQSQVEEAAKDIIRRAEAKKQGNVMENYYAFLQEMPLKPEDAFTKTGATPFDLDKINAQIANINTDKTFQIIQRGRLEWPKANGKFQFGGKPVWVMDDGSIDEQNPDREKFPFEIVEHPVDGFKNIHVSAVDPYHINDEFEEIATSKKKKGDAKFRSKGSMCVYRKFVNMETVGELPVAFYTDRPYTKDLFYESCLMMAIYYDCQILVEYNDDGFLKYFSKHKMLKYIKARPQSADSPWSQATNKYGIHMKSFQKKLVTELVDEYIKLHWEDIYFMKLLNEFVVYGKHNTDRVMAFGMALIHDMDSTQKIIDVNEDKKRTKDFIPHFQNDKNGNVISVYSEKNGKFDNTSRSANFDYNFD